MRYLHTMVRVQNLERSLDFYCNKLGLVETRRYDNEKGFTLVFLAAPEDLEQAKTKMTPVLLKTGRQKNLKEEILDIWLFGFFTDKSR